ncbi:MAG: TlpA family protein disulfide reductase [Chloroflexi bacterium]|nr:TlpA family protein disulfide reductase [Chloroflexota bacterium]
MREIRNISLRWLRATFRHGTIRAVSIPLELPVQTFAGILIFSAMLLSACGMISPSASTSANTNASARPSIVKIGDLAPEIKLKSMTGELVVLSQLKGKIVLVNFWATWCGPCRAEFPAFVRKTKEYADKDFVILGVNTQDENTDEGVLAFMRNSLVNFTIMRDLDGSAARAYRVTGLPTSVFIDRAGIVRDIIVGGPIPDAKIDEEIAKLQ